MIRLRSIRFVRARYVHEWAVLGLFTVLAVVLSWPLPAHFSSRLPGTATWAFDESTFVWNIWYFKHALLNLHTSPLHTELIWYPLGIDLILYTYNFFNALIALPLQVAFNLPFASNATLLLATILSGFGTYLLACYVLHVSFSLSRDAEVSAGSQGNTPRTGAILRLAALVAGIVYAFASNRSVYAALGHYDMVTTQWLPFYALYLLKTLREPRWKNGVMAGLFFALAALAEMIFASFLVLLTLIVLAAMWRALRQRWAALGRLTLAAVVALAIWSPVLVPVAREFITGDYALEGWGESVKLSADLMGLVTPTDLNPLWTGELKPETWNLGPGTWGSHWTAALRAVEEGKGRFSDVNTVFLGWVTLGLAVLGAWAGRRSLRAWSWSAFIFGLLCLGPLLQINGRYRFNLDNLLPEGVTFPLPFALLHFIPFINANRAPNRNSVILMLALAVLAGYGAYWLLSKLAGQQRSRGVEESPPGFAESRVLARPVLVYLSAFVLTALVILEHLAIPLPTTDARVPEIYHQIAAEPGEFAIMQLPLGWRNSFGVLGSEQTQLQYYQTVHGKAMLGGNISRAPAFKMEYFRRIPLFQALTDLEMYREVSPEVDAAARAQAAALMALYDVRYLITTPPIPGRYPYQDTWQRTEEYALETLPLEKPAFWEQDGYRAYRVIQPAVELPFRLDLGTSGIEPYLGQGWDASPAEQPYGTTADWAVARVAELYLPLSAPADLTLRLAIAPLAYENAPVQTLSINFNGAPILHNQLLSPGWQTLVVPVPARATRRGPNRVRLEFAWTASPRQVFPDPASRAVIGATGVVSPVNVDVHSFGEAYISTFAADGSETKASVGRRGYNVAVLEPQTGRLLDARGFDTAANPYEADALAAYLAGIPAGRIVILATKEDATAHLTPAAIAALRGLGSRVSSASELRGQAHALVGVQGASPGTAAEAIGPADVFLRVAGDFRTLAAAVDWVEIGP